MANIGERIEQTTAGHVSGMHHLVEALGIARKKAKLLKVFTVIYMILYQYLRGQIKDPKGPYIAWL